MVRPRLASTPDKWAGTHQSEGWGEPYSLPASASSAWHLQGLETFWDLLKSPNLLASLYHGMYLLICRHAGDPSTPLMRVTEVQCHREAGLENNQPSLEQENRGLAPRGGWVKRGQWNSLICPWYYEAEEGDGKSQQYIKTKLRKWNNKANISTRGEKNVLKKRQHPTWLIDK